MATFIPASPTLGSSQTSSMTRTSGLMGFDNHGGGAAIQRTESILRDICARLDNLSRHIDVASEALNRLVDTMERLSLCETPIILVKKETRERAACPLRASEKDRDGRASDMSHPMHVNIDG